jgi:hypothetical protein
MTHSFGATSTTDEVLRGIDLSGKRVLVTGVSAGLGVESARALAAHGARRSRSAPKPPGEGLFTWSNSTWHRSTVCAAAPTVCWPRASLST